MEHHWALLGLCALTVFATHFLGAVVGFGSSMLALPLLVFLLGAERVPAIVASLLVMGAVQALQMSWYTWRHADRGELLRIAGWMAVGMPFGAVFLRQVPSGPVVLVLGAVLVASGLVCLLPVRPVQWRHWGAIGPAVLVAAGMVHGAFACGGMMLAVYAQHALPDRDRFRGTLSIMWVVVNALLFALMIPGGRMSPVAWQLGVLAIPGVLLASWLGQRAAVHVSQRMFGRLVAVLLVCGGVAAAARVLVLR